MAPQVIFEISFCSEGLPTALVSADVGSLIIVYPLMNEQVVTLAKRFIASWEQALMRMLPRVKVHMCLQAISSRENFAASLHRAQKSLDWFLNRPSSPSFIEQSILLHWLACRLIS